MTAIKPKGRPLLQKIILPFFIILSTLGAGATFVSVLLIDGALSKTADEHLIAFEEVAFREIRKQEILLSTQTELLVNFLSDASNEEATSFTARLPALFQKSGIQTSIIPVGDLKIPAENNLDGLIELALHAGDKKFRFVTAPGGKSSLAVAAPLRQQGKIRHIVLLQTPIDQPLMSKLAAPFNANAFLFTPEGEVLAASGGEMRHHLPTPQEMEKLLSGERVFNTESTPLPHRNLFTAIPLGATDTILLSLEVPMTDLRALVMTLATGSVAAITAALLIGGFIYYRLIRRITAPVRELLAAAAAVGEGNLDYRISNITTDELGEVAEAFNRMMEQLEVFYKERLDQQRQLTHANEELKYKEIVEQKNREIERSNRELKVHLKEISALFQLNQAMISTLDLNLLFERILQVLKDVIHSNEMVLLLYNPGAEELEVRKSAGIEAETLKGVSFRLDEGITGQAARSQELIYIHDVATDTRNLNYKGRSLMRGSMVAAPMVVKNRLMGVLNLHKQEAGAFSDAEIKLIQAVVNQAAIAIENAQLYEKTKTLSNTDEVTTLANRRYFQQILAREVTQARRYGSSFSIIMADIDHFKQFNDIHGHLRGDALLRKVASLFLQNTRGIDLVARFGGEEFVILLPKTNKEGARAAAEKLRHCIAAEKVAGAERSQPGGQLTLSLGVAEFPTDSKDIYELIDLADRALYKAKEQGRNRTIVWNDKNPLALELPISPPEQTK